MGSSPPFLEAILSAVAYAATIVATVRAGSRATYMLAHGGSDGVGMGVVDGPLILGPADVERKKRELVESGVDWLDYVEDDGSGGLQVSPLWESSFGFQQAVRLAMHVGRPASRTGGGADCEWTEKIRYASVDTEVLSQGQKKGIVSRIFAGKEEAVPYSLSPRPTVKPKQGGASDGGGNDIDNRLRLTFDWHRGTASWGAGGSSVHDGIANRKRRRGVLKLLTGGGGNDDGSLDFNSMVSSRVAIPVNSDVSDDDDDDKGGRAKSATSSDRPPDRMAHISVYAPRAFARLRRMFGISESDYLRSMMKHFVSFQSNSKGAARAGLFFFFTRDGAYMIKTIKGDEAKTVSKMLPKYYTFMRRNAKRSLLTRFCGMYSVRITDAKSLGEGDGGGDGKEKEHVFIVMNAVFPAEASKFISERFDLKGSTVGRECSPKEREEKGPNAVLKDLDLAKEVSADAAEQSTSDEPKYGINVGSRRKEALLAQLRRDVGLLEDCQVMDYSLLVGVVRNKDDPKSILNRQQRPHSPLPFGLLNLREDSPIERIISSPIGKRIHGIVDTALWWVLPNSMPYYGAGVCGVDGGALSVIPGRRAGHRAVYYMGIIDFLQPWTWKKVMENEMKGILGYNTKAISCVSPKDYAARFLDFIDAHVT